LGRGIFLGESFCLCYKSFQIHLRGIHGEGSWKRRNGKREGEVRSVGGAAGNRTENRGRRENQNKGH
jgi:hypothetical protein